MAWDVSKKDPASGRRIDNYMNGSLLLDIRIENTLTFECDRKNVHSDGTKCASYCGAFQSLMYL